jgi:hypothetical protein
MREVVFRVLAECPGHQDAQAKWIKPSEALPLIGRGPMALDPEAAECEDDAYDSLRLPGMRLRAIRDSVALGAPLTTRKVRLLLDANPGAEQVTRAASLATCVSSAEHRKTACRGGEVTRNEALGWMTIIGIPLLIVAWTVPLTPFRSRAQPSFQPDTTPRHPPCDYPIIQGAQKELNKILEDDQLRLQSEPAWQAQVDLREGRLVYEAAIYYRCDLKGRLRKPVAWPKTRPSFYF